MLIRSIDRQAEWNQIDEWEYNTDDDDYVDDDAGGVAGKRCSNLKLYYTYDEADNNAVVDDDFGRQQNGPWESVNDADAVVDGDDLNVNTHFMPKTVTVKKPNILPI